MRENWVKAVLLFGEGDGTPLQDSCLENPMDGGALWAAVHGVAKTRLSNFTFPFHFPALEKEMATHSSVLAWRIPGTGEPGGRPSMGSHRVGHDWSDLAAAAVLLSGPKGIKWARPWPQNPLTMEEALATCWVTINYFSFYTPPYLWNKICQLLYYKTLPKS